MMSPFSKHCWLPSSKLPQHCHQKSFSLNTWLRTSKSKIGYEKFLYCSKKERKKNCNQRRDSDIRFQSCNSSVYNSELLSVISPVPCVRDQYFCFIAFYKRLSWLWSQFCFVTRHILVLDTYTAIFSLLFVYIDLCEKPIQQFWNELS